MVGGHLRGLLRHRDLIRMLTVDEVKRAYAGSMLGWLWVLLKPALVVGLYGVLFGFVFQTRSGHVRTDLEYFLVLLTGLLPWLAFSEAVLAASSSITANTALVTRTVFPIEILPISRVFGAMVSGLIALGLLVGIMAALHQVGWAIVLLPFLIMMQVIFTLGLAWVLSAVNVAVRDTSQMLPLALMGWMFLSPVVYTREMVPTWLAAVFSFNPMSYFLDGYRSILLTKVFPTACLWGEICGIALGAFLFGYWVFSKMRITMAELL